MTLAPREARFVDEYLLDLNGARAAVRAGYSARSARQLAARLLAKPSVRAEVDRRRQELAHRTGIEQERILDELASIAFSDMRDFATWGSDGVKLKAGSDLPAGTSRCIAEIVQAPTGVRIRLHNKITALHALGRHFGMFREPFHVDPRVALAALLGVEPEELPCSPR